MTIHKKIQKIVDQQKEWIDAGLDEYNKNGKSEEYNKYIKLTLDSMKDTNALYNTPEYKKTIPH